MLIVERVDTRDKKQVERFIDLPFRLYAGHEYWAPPIRSDVALMLNKKKHPFYEHSEADFFIAVRDGRDVGRIGAIVNNNYNQYHDTRMAQFYLLECEDDLNAATGLFTQFFSWAKARDLDTVIGPKGFGPLDGYGLAINGLGILPQFQGRGGNALLYAELENTIRDFGFEYCEMTQVAETAVQMRQDLENIGAEPDIDLIV